MLICECVEDLPLSVDAGEHALVFAQAFENLRRNEFFRIPMHGKAFCNEKVKAETLLRLLSRSFWICNRAYPRREGPTRSTQRDAKGSRRSPLVLAFRSGAGTASCSAPSAKRARTRGKGSPLHYVAGRPRHPG
eukprot:scaffold214_cov249-Pinguiococcus_pyrenoidosus.AAC.31